MNNFDKLYNTLIQEAAKQTFNRPRLSLAKIKQMIIQGYIDVANRLKMLNNGEMIHGLNRYLTYQQGEEIKVKELLDKIYKYDGHYIEIFQKSINDIAKNANNPKVVDQLIKELWRRLRGTDMGYQTNIANHLNEYVRQGAKLAMVRILNASKLTEIVEEYNEQGLPVLRFHLLPKYIQLKILLDLNRSKQLKTTLIERIRETIFNSREANKHLEQELKNYFREVATVPKEDPKPTIDHYVDIKSNDDNDIVPERPERAETEVENKKRSDIDRIRQAQNRLKK